MEFSTIAPEPILTMTDAPDAKESNVYILPPFVLDGYWYSVHAFISFCYFWDVTTHYVTYVKPSQRILLEHSATKNICLRAMDNWFKINNNVIKEHTFPLHKVTL